MDRGRYGEAAEAFEKSQALTPSASTLLNLGNAYARLGDHARAFTTFERALALADQASSEAQRQALTRAAQEQLEVLRPRVASLAIRPPTTEGVQVQLNGQVLQPGALRPGSLLRLNPGLYRLEATAPGKLPYSESLQLLAGQSIERRIPPLADVPTAEVTAAPAPTVAPPVAPPAVAPVAGARPPSPASEPERNLTLNTEPSELDTSASPRFGALPWALAGAGAGLVGVSLITGLSAKSKADAVKKSCPSLRNCDLRLQDDYDTAKTLGTVTDVLWISGAAGIAAGLTLFILRAGDPEPSELQAGCFIGGCTVRGRF